MSVLSIEPGSAWESWRVFEYTRYGPNTAMAGMTRRQWIEDFPTIESALIAYPEADVMDPRQVNERLTV